MVLQHLDLPEILSSCKYGGRHKQTEIHDKSVNLLKETAQNIFKNMLTLKHLQKGHYTFYEIVTNNDESMGPPSRLIIRPFDVCRQLFYHYSSR